MKKYVPKVIKKISRKLLNRIGYDLVYYNTDSGTFSGIRTQTLIVF